MPQTFDAFNRKSYPIRAIKTDVASPVLGFNFTKKHRLDTRWTEFGDVVMYDAKAQIQSVLKYKVLEPGQVHKLSVIDSSVKAKPSHQFAAEVAAVEVSDVFGFMDREFLDLKKGIEIKGFLDPI